MQELDFISPLNGEIIPLEEVNDPAISEKMLGDGFAIKPDNGKVVSPVSGVITALYPTGHAIGILSDEGYEFLIHIGVNTFKLKGEEIKVHIKAEQHVKQQELLVEFNKEKLELLGVDVTTSILFINREEFKLLKQHEYVTTADKHLFQIGENNALKTIRDGS
jgi:glucose-specific phosphotransferase system IIA component